MSSKVRVLQVGLGRIGSFHAETLASRTPGAELAAVVDADADRAERFGRRFAVPWSQHLGDALHDQSIDAVLIATPTPLHAEMVEQAAAAGKHIFCEKPISLDRQRADEAIAAAARAGVKLQVGFHRRFDPDYLAVRARIDAGDLGDVRFFRATCRDMVAPSLDFLMSCGGIFADVTLHDFDMARWLVGEVAEVYAMGAALSDPAIADVAGDVDSAVVALRFDSGALGLIDNSRVAAYGYETSLEVMGSRSTVRIGQAAQRVTNVEVLAGAAVTADIGTDFVARFAAAYVGEVAAFVRAVADDEVPSPGGADASAALDLVLAAQRSMALDKPVRVGD